MNKKIRYKNILVLTVGFSLLSFFFESDVLLKMGVAIGVVGLINVHAASAILLVWGKIALILGWINTRIILGTVYYIFLVPLALISQMTRKASMRTKPKNLDSVYVKRNHKYLPKDLENIW